MAVKKNSLNFPVKTFLIISVLAFGSVAGLYALGQNTDYRQRASEDINLNSADDITSTTNADKTMGPATAMQNYSTTLASSVQGRLALKVIDPPQTPDKGNNGNAYGKDKGKYALPSQTPSGAYQTPVNSPFTSLIVKVKKAEVHLAKAGDTAYAYPSATQMPDKLYPSPTNRKPFDKLTGADKWETLILDESLTYIDLIDLAKTGNSQLLGMTQLAAGKYTQIRLYIEQATGTLPDGKEVDITLPQKPVTVKIVRPFTIEVGKTTTLVVDFSAEKSVRQVGNNYILRPVVTRLLIEK